MHFDTENFITDKVKEELAKVLNEEGMKVFNKMLEFGCVFSTKHSSYNRYEYASVADLQLTNCGEFQEANEDIQGVTIEGVIVAVAAIYTNLCKKLEDMGYGCYDVSDEDVLELCKNTEYYEDGRAYDA
ncbi:MAG: hypothetical protein NC218_01985 [Acetobacter sp.]|nr:hypothetical protein [Acetobacter sp.]